jgi:hypothetical protein
MIQDRFANAIHMVRGTLCLFGTLLRGHLIIARTGKLLHPCSNRMRSSAARNAPHNVVSISALTVRQQRLERKAMAGVPAIPDD